MAVIPNEMDTIPNNDNFEVPESYIEMNLDQLTGKPPMKKIMVLNAIFSLLFPNEASLLHITPLRRRTLLAAAEVVEESPDSDFNREIFEACKIPYDPIRLRQLAGQTLLK